MCRLGTPVLARADVQPVWLPLSCMYTFWSSNVHVLGLCHGDSMSIAKAAAGASGRKSFTKVFIYAAWLATAGRPCISLIVQEGTHDCKVGMLACSHCRTVATHSRACGGCVFTCSAQHVHSTSCTLCRAWMKRKQLACSRPAQMAQAHVMPPAQTWKHPLLRRSPSLMQDVTHWPRCSSRKQNINVHQPMAPIQNASAMTFLLPF